MARNFAGGASGDDKVTVDAVASSSDWSVSFHIDLVFDAVARRLFEWRQTSGTLLAIMHISTDELVRLTVGWTTNGLWRFPIPSSGDPHVVVITYAGSGGTGVDPKIYYDGVEQTLDSELTTPSDTQNSDTTPEFYIGNSEGGTRSADGDISEVALWNSVLSDGEIAEISDRFSPRMIATKPAIYLPLMGNNSPEPELMQGKSGILTGTTKAVHSRVIYPSAQILQFPSVAAQAAINPDFTPMGQVSI